MNKVIGREGGCESQLRDSRDGANAPASPPHAVGPWTPEKLLSGTETRPYRLADADFPHELQRSRFIWFTRSREDTVFDLLFSAIYGI
jgi:hypothetical protein